MSVTNYTVQCATTYKHSCAIFKPLNIQTQIRLHKLLGLGCKGHTYTKHSYRGDVSALFVCEAKLVWLWPVLDSTTQIVNYATRFYQGLNPDIVHHSIQKSIHHV